MNMPTLRMLRELRREVWSLGRHHGAQDARAVLAELDRDIYVETCDAVGYDPLSAS